MNLEDLKLLAGVTKSPYDTPVQEQPTEIEEQPVMDDAEGMRTLIALVTPEQLNQLTGEAPVEEEGYANSGDHYSGEPEEYKGTLGSPADLSLRRYLGANGQPVHVDETKVYEDHKVEDITEAWNKFKAEPVEEDYYSKKNKKKEEAVEEAVVDEDDVEEDNAFNTAAANAKKAGKSHFTFNNKKYPVKIDDKTADALTDDIDRIKDLAGVQVDEAPFPGEFDYTNSPQEDEEIKAIMMKHPEEAKKLKATGDIDSGSDLYMDLFSYYLDSGEMPYGTAKARDGDPVEWILDRLDDMGMPMGNLESVEQKVDEAPFPGEYDYSDDKYDADGAVTGVNDRDVDLRFAKWSKDTPSQLMAVINKLNLTPDEAWQMGNRDNMADVDIVVDYHDKFTDRFDTSGMDDDEITDAIDIDGGEEWLESPEHDALYRDVINPLCQAMGMEGGNVEECGQALMKYIDDTPPQESAEINDLRKLAGI